MPTQTTLALGLHKTTLLQAEESKGKISIPESEVEKLANHIAQELSKDTGAKVELHGVKATFDLSRQVGASDSYKIPRFTKGFEGELNFALARVHENLYGAAKDARHVVLEVDYNEREDNGENAFCDLGYLRARISSLKD